MRKIFILIILVSLTSSLTAQVLNLEGNIDYDRAGEFILGESLDVTLRRLQNLSIEPTEHGGYRIFSDTLEELIIGSKHQNGKIGYIKIYSSKFESRKGLKVGMSLEEIIKIYPSTSLCLDEKNLEVYIAPPELQIYSGKKPVILCLFFLKMRKNIEEINFAFNESNQTFEAHPDDLEGEIEYVHIYSWD